MKQEYTTQARWDRGYDSLQLQAAAANDPIRAWLKRSVPRSNGSCLELGCYPGRYLAVLAEMGYEVHGLDRTPRVTPDLRDWMQRQGYRTGQFTCGDVFTHRYDRQYDVVGSFGLIEHFGNWPELVAIHAERVRSGGWLVISTPNFRGGFQRVMHQWLDAPNLSEHNLDAMQPHRWAEVIRPLGFDILQCGFIGPFDFWVGAQPRPRWQRGLLKLMQKLKWAGRILPDNVGFYAPYCALVARKIPV